MTWIRILVALMLPLALNAQATRIVSTTPSITEMLFALGFGDRVVGDTTYCNYPEEAKALPKIGTYAQLNLEAIVALQPDLVILQENPLGQRQAMEALGLRVLELRYESINDIYSALDQIAQAAGEPQRSEALRNRIQADLEGIRTRAAALPKRKMMFLVGRTPNALTGMIAVGSSSYLNELMTLAGGINIFADAPTGYPKISLESILARDPDVIVDMGEMANTVGVTEADRQRVIGLWRKYPALRAVHNNRVFAVSSDIFVVPGPRMVDAAREFFRMLHPELDQ